MALVGETLISFWHVEATESMKVRKISHILCLTPISTPSHQQQDQQASSTITARRALASAPKWCGNERWRVRENGMALMRVSLISYMLTLGDQWWCY